MNAITLKTNNDYLFSAISSKLRNPLTNVVGMIGLIENVQTNNANFSKYIDIIKESTSDILKLANNIVDILNIKQNNMIVTKRRN